MDWNRLLFSHEGRINRAKYWVGVLIYAVAPDPLAPDVVAAAPR